MALVLVTALRRARAAVTRTTAEADLAVYKDQLAEIERDLARGTIARMEEAGRLRAEVGKRVLEADRARHAGEVWSNRGGPDGGHGGADRCAITLPGRRRFTGDFGAPGYPDMALKPRLAALDEAIAARPGQEAELGPAGPDARCGLWMRNCRSRAARR